MFKKTMLAVVLVLFVLVTLLPPATAQRPTRVPRNPGGIPRLLCDVEGLWGYATFKAKLDAPTLEKLRPVCQKGYDEREALIGKIATGKDSPSWATFRELGETLVREAKAALGEDASGKIQPWFDMREATVNGIPRPSEAGQGRRARPRAIGEHRQTDEASKADDKEDEFEDEPEE